MPRHGSTTNRGYGYTHQKKRAEWEPKVKAGGVTCWRCIANGVPTHGALIKPNEPWDLGHEDGTAGSRRPIWKGPEHIRCNRATRSRQRHRAGTTTVTAPALAFFEPNRIANEESGALGA